VVNVLIVDDSSFIRKTVKSFLESDPQIHVIGEAGDGQEAMYLADELNPDVITMDLNMPQMDGVTAIREILKSRFVPILVFTSASDRDGPKVLEALHAGAVDFISKEAGDTERNKEKIINKLRSRVLALGNNRAEPDKSPLITQTPVNNVTPLIPAHTTRKSSYEIIVIGASTGGPVVIENILKNLVHDFPFPILIVQHMPAEFTRAFAERLNSLCSLSVVEAVDGMHIKPGTVYLAPGGRQMEVASNGSGKLIRITDHGNTMNYKPCVDITFASVAAVFGKDVLAIVLTGMGSDGKKGAETLKQHGATIWVQDQKTSVVFGMPMAIINHNLADKILPATDIGTRLARVH